MTMQQARKLRDHLRAGGIKCTVPLGKQSYFVRAQIGRDKIDFRSSEEWNEYAKKQNQRIVDFARDHGIMTERRSPIEIMIDKACGLD